MLRILLSLLSMPFLLLGCAEILVLPPIPGGLREVHIERPPPTDHESPWRVGNITALPPTPLEDVWPSRGNEAVSVVLTWDVVAAEPHGVVWQAACTASSYMSRKMVGDAAMYREPTAVVCDLRRHADEKFHFELTHAGSAAEVGTMRDETGGTVAFDRAEAQRDSTDVPDRFLIRYDGTTVGWLRTRPTPRLFVARDLDKQRQRSVERATLLALSLDNQAARQLSGTAQLAAPWARSNRPGRVAIGNPAP